MSTIFEISGSTRILSLLLLLLCHASSCADRSRFNQLKFDEGEWKHNISVRHRMIQDLQSSRIINGISQASVERILGKASLVEKGENVVGMKGRADLCLYYDLDLDSFPGAVESAVFIVLIKEGKSISSTIVAQ